MNEIMMIKNVRGFKDESGVAQLNLEDVSRGLGFTETKNNVEYIRWRTVSNYLREFKFATSCEKDKIPEYIPENIFYKLCFKAKNETARRFQDLVTDEVLPSIRKHGTYMTDQKIEDIILNPDTVIKLAQELKSEREEKKRLAEKVEFDKPKVMFANSVIASKRAILVRELAKLLKQNHIDIGQNRLYKWLRENGYIVQKGLEPTQKSMNLQLFEVEETVYFVKNAPRVNFITKVTPKGQVYFINKLTKERNCMRE